MKLKRKDGVIVEANFKELNMVYIDKIMELQQRIIKAIVNKEIYAATDKLEFVEIIKNTGKIIGCVTDDDELIAMGVYVANGYNEHNYGYDIDIQGEELLKVGQIESTVVIDEFRGNSLQKILCEILEKIAINNNTPILCATVSPYNEFSLNTFIKLGYRIGKDKLKYGGLRRYVLVKELL